MKHIPLRNSDLKVKVDDEDYEQLAQYSWTLKKQHGKAYALRFEHGQTIYMHRHILGLRKGDKKCSDHINHNGLDNRRSNLRIATVSQNAAYCKKVKDKSRVDGYFGILKCKDGSYAVRRIAGTKLDQTKYSSARKAAKAYDKYAIHIHKEFAVLNFPKRNSYKKA